MERRVRFFKITILFLFIPFLLWTILQFLAPISLPQGSVEDLSGLTAVSDNEKIINDMPSPWNSIYSIGDRLCHQRADRSFFINGNQMPFCSRCTAIWIGITTGLAFMIFYKIKLDGRFIILIIIGLVPIAIDGLGQLVNLWESTNISRLITGILIGVVCGLALGIIVDELKDIFKLIKNKK